MKKNIIITSEYEKSLNLLKNGCEVLFISGKAGVGKSVLINFLQKELSKLNKKVALSAPTGIAAINVSGQTIHSMFGLGFGALSPSNVSKRKGRKQEVLKKLDILIIDEISMVRADLLDAIDVSLRKNRESGKPFGGVQIVMVGDLFQLSPIIKGYEEKKFIFNHYETEYFFSSHCLQNISYKSIILDKVFRQNDGEFIEILNRIRTNDDHRNCLGTVNRKCYGLNAEFSKIPRAITLTTVNKKADYINNSSLKSLDTPMHSFSAKIDGKFTTSMITPKTLNLKVGAKVMFTKNGELWANGTLGEVSSIHKRTIVVKLLGSNRSVVVEKEKWEIIEYEYNEEKDELDKIIVGSFEQFPLTLAWAITIHKSQGLTLESINIDLDSGAFATGQVYVALSRAVSLSSISLAKPISMKDVTVDQRVVDFYAEIEKQIL